jgi:hypothetical protein
MAKRETAEKIMTKLATTSKAAASNTEASNAEAVDRRRALPQPDFKHYKEASSYPGASFFFVGHSYNVEHRCCSGQFNLKRKSAIKNVLKQANKHQTVTVKHALEQPTFFAVLSRVERDWLGRLPEGALIGPAIDQEGKVVAQSFTVWRQEQRQPKTAAKVNSVAKAKAKAKSV